MKLLNFLSDKFSVQDNYKEQVRVKKYEFKKLDIEALTKDNVDGDLNAQHRAEPYSSSRLYFFAFLLLK